MNATGHPAHWVAVPGLKGASSMDEALRAVVAAVGVVET
jgi:hypothetical protein